MGAPIASQPAAHTTQLSTARGHENRPRADLMLLDMTPYDIPGYRSQSASALETARVIVTADPEVGPRLQPPCRFLVQFGQAAIAERLYFKAARYFHLPQQRVFWSGVPGAPDLVASAVQLEPHAFIPQQVEPLSGCVTVSGRRRPLANRIDYLRHVALRAFLGAEGTARSVMRGRRLIGVGAADCTPYARGAECWQHVISAQRACLSAEAAQVVIEALETIAQHPEIAGLIGDDLEQSPFPSLHQGLEEYYVDAVEVTHAGLVECRRRERYARS